jgi:nucleoside-diphosphate-sugar epimerase
MRVFVTGGSGFVGGRLIASLVADGDEVRALARSDAAAKAVSDVGAEPVRGDLSDSAAITEGAAGCELAFHSAAKVDDFGPWEDFVRVNVDGTRNVVRGCAAAGVRRLVHVSTEAVLIAGEPLVDVDETAPRRTDSKAPYSRSKAMAEEVVLGEAGIERVIVRPRFVWGAGDTTLLPEMTKMVKGGRFAWIGGGGQLTDTTHVENVVHGLRLGAERGDDGEIYFLTDDDRVVFREFVSDMIRTQGLEPPTRSVPSALAGTMAAACETAWRLLPLRGQPPLSRFVVWVLSQECTIDISKAKRDLGYAPVKARDEGLAELMPG